jgi:probable HAF family extracellular repeat protein
VKSYNASLSLALFLLAAGSALAQGTYTQIDVPGSIETRVQAIDTAGDIAGSYDNSGFVLSGGAYTTINYPEAYSTEIVGMSDFGQLVLDTTGDSYASVLYDSQTQTFTVISCPPDWATYTLAAAINNAGTIVGSTVGYTGFGFEWSPSVATCNQINGGEVIGITAKGQLVVAVSGRPGPIYTYSLLYRGKYRTLTIPLPIANPGSFVVAGINSIGNALVGTYQPSSSGIYSGFLYQGKTLTTLQFPGAAGTYATGVNDAGEVVGYFEDSSGNSHGFTWTPPSGGSKESRPFGKTVGDLQLRPFRDGINR